MATVYIIYSSNLDKFYIGVCKDLTIRIEQHNSGFYKNSYTSKTSDWVLYFQINSTQHSQALSIENHIKKMKSRRYLVNLQKHPEMTEVLLRRFDNGSSR